MVLPEMEELQRSQETRSRWMGYAALDAKATLQLHQALQTSLEAMPVHMDAAVAVGPLRSPAGSFPHGSGIPPRARPLKEGGGQYLALIAFQSAHGSRCERGEVQWLMLVALSSVHLLSSEKKGRSQCLTSAALPSVHWSRCEVGKGRCLAFGGIAV
jgi:hypothetical protein